MVNNKVRRLTTSVSSANIPEMRAQTFTPTSNYNSHRPQNAPEQQREVAEGQQ